MCANTTAFISASYDAFRLRLVIGIRCDTLVRLKTFNNNRRIIIDFRTASRLEGGVIAHIFIIVHIGAIYPLDITQFFLKNALFHTFVACLHFSFCQLQADLLSFC